MEYEITHESQALVDRGIGRGYTVSSARMFGIAGFADAVCSASVSRIVVLVSIVRSVNAKDKLCTYLSQTLNGILTPLDAFSTTLIWSQVELALAIVASSAATLRPLFRSLGTITSAWNSERKGSGPAQQLDSQADTYKA